MYSLSFPEWDRDLFLYLNSKHTPWLDGNMSMLSAYYTWSFVCLALIFFIIYRKKRVGIYASFFLVLGLGINSLVNNVVKLIIMRPRPGHEPLLIDIIHQLEDVGTHYSFFSAHSSNSVCLALFTTLYFRNKYYGILAFIWALLVAYSRIYVGKHYPLDVVCGILFGLITGWFSYWLFDNYIRKKIFIEADIKKIE